MERTWLAVNGALFIPEIEFDLLSAEAGCGILEL